MKRHQFQRMILSYASSGISPWVRVWQYSYIEKHTYALNIRFSLLSSDCVWNILYNVDHCTVSTLPNKQFASPLAKYNFVAVIILFLSFGRLNIIKLPNTSPLIFLYLFILFSFSIAVSPPVLRIHQSSKDNTRSILCLLKGNSCFL